MKKFIAVGITALGGFGLIGLGAGAASAAPSALVPTASALVCTSATTQLAALSPALASANAVANNATNAYSASQAIVGTSETSYITDAMKVVTDTDNLALPQQITADTVTFTNATTAFVTAVVNESAASVTNFNAVKTATQLNLQHKVLSDLIAQACMPV